jgi:hypothetical protein
MVQSTGENFGLFFMTHLKVLNTVSSTVSLLTAHLLMIFSVSSSLSADLPHLLPQHVDHHFSRFRGQTGVLGHAKNLSFQFGIILPVTVASFGYDLLRHSTFILTFFADLVQFLNLCLGQALENCFCQGGTEKM